MSAPIDTKNHPTVKALESHRLRLGLNDAQFAQRLRVSPAAWSTMRDGTYAAQNKTPMLERFEAALAHIEDQAAISGLPGTRDAIIDLRHTRAAVKAVKRAAGEDRNRLVVYLSRTGGGKSTLCRHLQEIYLDSCVAIEATETWRDSYYAALLTVCRALSISDGTHNARAAELAVIDHLAGAPRILVFDELHHGGKAALNLLKMILNRCREVRIVGLAIPQLWDRMQLSNAQEAAQLRSRTCAKIVVSEIGAEDCAAFLAAKMPGYAGFKGDVKEAVAAAADAANRFGLFDTLQRICDDELLAKAKVLDLDEVIAAINRVEALRS